MKSGFKKDLDEIAEKLANKIDQKPKQFLPNIMAMIQ